MDTFGIFGFVFAMIAFVTANRLAKDIKQLQRQVEDLEKRIPPGKDS